MSDHSESFEVSIDGKLVWQTDGFGEEYDAIHAAAGALLAGADNVTIFRRSPSPSTSQAERDAEELSDEDGESA